MFKSLLLMAYANNCILLVICTSNNSESFFLMFYYLKRFSYNIFYGAFNIHVCTFLFNKSDFHKVAKVDGSMFICDPKKTLNATKNRQNVKLHMYVTYRYIHTMFLARSRLITM